MNVGAALQGVETPTALEQEHRDSKRFTVAVQTTCQPPSAWGKTPWPATIRNISTGGMSLSLERRFERGSGLAIELPGDEGSSSTVLARITYVRANPEGGWVLGCSFISELSDEEVQTVLQIDQLLHATCVTEEAAAEQPPASCAAIAGVLFQGRLPSGEVVRWYVKRLDLAGTWPLERDRAVTLQLDGTQPPLELLVRKCVPLGESWVVNVRFRVPPTSGQLRALGYPG